MSQSKEEILKEIELARNIAKAKANECKSAMSKFSALKTEHAKCMDNVAAAKDKLIRFSDIQVGDYVWVDLRHSNEKVRGIVSSVKPVVPSGLNLTEYLFEVNKIKKDGSMSQFSVERSIFRFSRESIEESKSNA